MTSGDSYQCTSMDDDDDELEGNSPTSIWRRDRKRKDYSDDEDVELREIMEEDPEEEEDEPVINAKPIASRPPSPIHVAAVKINVPPGNRKQTARMSTGGKAPKHALVSKNVVSTLIDREISRPTKTNYPGEWDHQIPKKKKAPSPEWKPSSSTVEKNLMKNLDKTAGVFEQAYIEMMKIFGKLEDHYKEKEREKAWAEYEKEK